MRKVGIKIVGKGCIVTGVQYRGKYTSEGLEWTIPFTVKNHCGMCDHTNSHNLRTTILIPYESKRRIRK